MQPVQNPPAERFRLFAPIPASGPWTAVGLSRGQFLGILLGACLIYLFLGGPLWLHLRQNDFLRISVSYLAIPLAVVVAQRHNGTLKLSTWFAASGVIASLKLLATAGLAVAFGISH